MKLKDENLYYIGGVVRDEILGVGSVDVDYCYEGNAIEFAKNLDVIKTNPAFGTVRVRFQDGDADIASTRTETYPRKGHLPVVANIGCPLKDDLRRRDFTINAMAKRTLDGTIVDCFGGMDDINNKLLRVLHKESFIDDPTRIVRGLKFSVRFGFELEKETRKLQDEYLQNINYDMSFHRLKKELVETFGLNKQAALDEFISQGIYKLLGENQAVPQVNVNIEEKLKSYNGPHTWLIYMALFDLSNLELTRAERRIIEWAEKLKTQNAMNNTPLESIIIREIKDGGC